MNGANILTSIFQVFTTVVDWFVVTLNSATGLFYADGALTLIGNVTIIGFAIAVSMMILAWVRSILRGQ